MTQVIETYPSDGSESSEREEPAIHPKFWNWLLITILALGVAARLREYFLRASYWNDEAFVVLNVMDHPAARLLGPLDYKQAAPPVFLWIEQSAGLTLGWGELSLRLFPLAAGLTALGVFALLARRVLPIPLATFAAGFYALNDKLIDYCAQVKQYSSDALVGVLLLLIAVGARRNWSATKRFLGIAALTAAGVWLSHTSVIVFGALSLMLLADCWREGPRGRLAWVGGNAAVLVSLVVLYFLSIRHEHDKYLYDFWAEGFPPLNHLVRVPLWFAGQLWDLSQQPFRSVWELVAILEALGAAWLWVRDRALFWACLGPVLLTVAAAFLHQYPFSPSRLTLFMMPGMLLLCAAGAGLLWERLGGAAKRFWPVLPGIVLVYGISASITRAIHPLFRSHIRPAVEYVRAHRQPGDMLIVTGQRVPGAPEDEPTRHLELFCYWRHPEPPVSVVFPPPGGLPRGRFWIIYPYAPRKGTAFIRPVLEEVRAVADERGKPFVVKQGAKVHLFVHR